MHYVKHLAGTEKAYGPFETSVGAGQWAVQFIGGDPSEWSVENLHDPGGGVIMETDPPPPDLSSENQGATQHEDERVL